MWLKLLAPSLGAIAGLLALRFLMPHWVSQQLLSRALSHLGRWAPLAFIALLILRPLVLMPGQLLTAIGGLLFGTLAGGIYAMIGSFASTFLVFLLANRLGKRLMKKVAGEHYPALVKAAQEHSFSFAVLVTINPLFPTDVAIALAAAAKARFWPTALGVLVGTLPGTFLTAAFGSAVGQGKTIMTTVSGVAMVLSLVLGALLGKRVVNEVERTEKRAAPPRAHAPGFHTQNVTICPNVPR